MGRLQNGEARLKDRIRRRGVLHKVRRCTKDERCGLTIASVNVNGLTEVSRCDVEAAVVQQHIDVLGISETKWRKEGYEKFRLEGFDIHEARRSDVIRPDGKRDRNGGGLLVATRRCGLVFKRYSPPIKDQSKAYVQNERVWVEFTTERGSTAICFPYLGYQARDDRHGKWNDGIYKVLESEITVLRSKGYRILLMGDFNGWVGDVLTEGGIPGNRKGTNPNGRRFLDFLNRNQLVHLNGATRYPRDWSTRVSSGLWSRHGRGSTVLDYGVLSKEHLSSVISFKVDSDGSMGGDTDHVFIITQLTDRFGESQKQLQCVKRPRWDVDESTDWSEFQQIVEAKLLLVDTSSEVEVVYQGIMEALIEGLEKGIGKRSPPKPPKDRLYPADIVKMVKERKLLEASFKVAKSCFMSSSGSDDDCGVLAAQLLLQEKGVELEQALGRFAREGRSKVLKRCHGSSTKARKLFWRYVSLKSKVSTDICVRVQVLC